MLSMVDFPCMHIADASCLSSDKATCETSNYAIMHSEQFSMVKIGLITLYSHSGSQPHMHTIEQDMGTMLDHTLEPKHS